MTTIITAISIAVMGLACLLAIVILTLRSVPVPDVLTIVLSTAAGALLGQQLPNKKNDNNGDK